jgi:2'-5' RNA ligase superfamily
VTGALIVTADLSPPDFAWVDRLRRQHYPGERNTVPAHLTIFQTLAPSALDEARRQLSVASKRPPPKATIAGMMDLGTGVAFRVVSEELDAIREELADHLHGLLSAQDSGGWRPHVTIQNKVKPREAKALLHELKRGFEPRALGISGLSLHRYLDGPWETVARYPFRGVS